MAVDFQYLQHPVHLVTIVLEGQKIAVNIFVLRDTNAHQAVLILYHVVLAFIKITLDNQPARFAQVVITVIIRMDL